MTRPSAKDFEPAGVIMEYIREERERCAALVKMLHAEPDLLAFCIMAPAYPSEDIGQWRKRFEAEHDIKDPFEDLM